MGCSGGGDRCKETACKVEGSTSQTGARDFTKVQFVPFCDSDLIRFNEENYVK
jgi:hypothetical protein